MGRRKRPETKRTTDVNTVAVIVRASVKAVKEFLKRDQSFALSKFNLNPDRDDPRLVALLPAVENEEFLEVQLRRLLAARRLALRRENFHLTDAEFLRREGLAEDALRGLQIGRLCRRIENAIGIDGVSILLLPSIPKLYHLKQEQEPMLVKRLSDPDFQDDLQLAHVFTPLLHLYQRGFDDDISFYMNRGDRIDLSSSIVTI